jgi:two-component system copper resistance phosphate regulon response regulator CusR
MPEVDMLHFRFNALHHMRLLIVEDAARLRMMLGEALSRMGHGVDLAEDGADGEAMARINSYDVIVLDRMLPHKDGLDVLRDLRRDGIATPILLLTALDGVDEKVRGFGLGADDYLTKPFALAELVARLEALTRRHHGQADSLLTIGPLEIDLAAKSVRRDGASVFLTAREFSLLEVLARRPGRVYNRAQIEERIYAEGETPLSNAVDAAIYSLRRKLSPAGAPALIHTRRGLGYVLELP